MAVGCHLASKDMAEKRWKLTRQTLRATQDNKDHQDKQQSKYLGELR